MVEDPDRQGLRKHYRVDDTQPVPIVNAPLSLDGDAVALRQDRLGSVLRIAAGIVIGGALVATMFLWHMRADAGSAGSQTPTTTQTPTSLSSTTTTWWYSAYDDGTDWEDTTTTRKPRGKRDKKNDYSVTMDNNGFSIQLNDPDAKR